jgi:hypothetical protein
MAMALTIAAALLVPASTFAAAAPVDDAVGSVTFDTPKPKPTAKPTAKPKATPKAAGATPTPKPTATPKPTPTPRPTLKAATVPFPRTPERKALKIGFTGNSTVRLAPLMLAERAGYFDSVGLKGVTFAKTSDAVADLQAGKLDIAVVDAQEAATAAAEDPRLQAVAGYRNYATEPYGGDLLLAAPGLVADQPATTMAFQTAYIFALQQLSSTKAARQARDELELSGVKFGAKASKQWPNAVKVFRPFDGGFGSLDDEGGLGELTAYLSPDPDAEVDIRPFIAQSTLNIAQQWSKLEPNPANVYAGPPESAEIIVGMAATDGAVSPISTAADDGFFKKAGFDTVEVMDVEQPLLGVLQGDLDFAVVDAADAADGAAQGLPLVALAGHRNYAADGTYGGDMLVTSAETLEFSPATTARFVVAYVGALRELTGEAALAPHDGGFGDRLQGGGLAELQAYLDESLGSTTDLDALIGIGPLEYAQTWRVLPANPTLSEETQ